MDIHTLGNWRSPGLYKILAVWLGCAVLGVFLIHFFPAVYGTVSGGIIGGLFAGFLARHETIYAIVQNCLCGFYTLLVVGVFDFMFLLLTYLMLNTCFSRKGSLGDIAGLALRALGRLLCAQLILAVAFLVFFRKWDGFSVFLLIPPFVTQGMLGGLFMLVWEFSVFVFAFGYAFMEDGIKAWFAGLMLAVTHFPVMLFGFTAAALVTWIPAFIFEKLNLPPYCWIGCGVFLHTLVFSTIVWFFIRQPDITEMLTPKA